MSRILLKEDGTPWLKAAVNNHDDDRLDGPEAEAGVMSLVVTELELLHFYILLQSKAKS